MEQPTRFIGMDVHKDTIVVAVTAAGDVGKATPYGTFPNTAAAVEKLVSPSFATRPRFWKSCDRGMPIKPGIVRPESARAG